ncbi:MAG TPA: ParB/RepB/Spo0J family partition protein [bacterium]|nr:ParB/RepB/Spo0J family partition protein [bacterium]
MSRARILDDLDDLCDLLNPRALIVPHPVTDREKLAGLAQAMQSNGWTESPIVAFDEIALCGAHRLAAAHEADILIPVIQLTRHADTLWGEGALADIEEAIADCDDAGTITATITSILRRRDDRLSEVLGLDAY